MRGLRYCIETINFLLLLTNNIGSPFHPNLCHFSFVFTPNVQKLEKYLLSHREEYFEHSARNYTAEQRKYNNDLTRGLLDVAAEEGYVFEDFTFPMLRDRIRCYYKSYSQAVKKKARLQQKKAEERS